MDYYDFRKYVYWLGEYIPIDMQKQAINELYNCDDKYIDCIIDINNTATWTNGLKVIAKIGYPRNKTAIKSILYLFQDVNWSTTQLAVETVGEIYKNEPEIVINAINEIINIAKDDEDWLFGIDWLQKKLDL